MPDSDNPYAIVPVGTVFAFAGVIDAEKETKLAKGGWLPCDGRPLDGTDPQYQVLFEVLGTAHGAGFDEAGAQTGTFNLPDYRGLFLRGLSDLNPAAADRRAGRQGANASGLGSIQPFATARPSRHPFTTNKDGQHQHQDPTFNASGGPYELADSGRQWGYDYGPQSAPTGGDATHVHVVGSGGDAETRPANAFVHYIIKYRQV